jgi:hypothetical protein
MNSSECLCSFAIGDLNLLKQAIYLCRTCYGEESYNCCCSGCAFSCHSDHDVVFFMYGEAYCDCGKNSCELYTRSLPVAVELGFGQPPLKYLNYSKISESETNRTKIEPFSIHKIEGINKNSVISFKEQCMTVISNSKETFWVGINDEANCDFEFLAKLIFNYHTSSNGYNIKDDNSIDPTCTGAEWWIQAKYVTDDNENNLYIKKDNDSYNFNYIDSNNGNNNTDINDNYNNYNDNNNDDNDNNTDLNNSNNNSNDNNNNNTDFKK